MNDFKNWLIKEKKMNDRSARDVISRLKRSVNITNSSNEIISCEMLTDEIIINMSTFVKSQLRRSVSLWIEFKLLIS